MLLMSTVYYMNGILIYVNRILYVPSHILHITGYPAPDIFLCIGSGANCILYVFGVAPFNGVLYTQSMLIPHTEVHHNNITVKYFKVQIKQISDF